MKSGQRFKGHSQRAQSPENDMYGSSEKSLGSRTGEIIPFLFFRNLIQEFSKDLEFSRISASWGAEKSQARPMDVQLPRFLQELIE